MWSRRSDQIGKSLFLIGAVGFSLTFAFVTAYFVGLFLPVLASDYLVLATWATLLIAFILRSGPGRWGALALLIMAIGVGYFSAFLPYELSRVRSSGGRVFVLAHDFAPTDTVYSVWDSVEPLGVLFRLGPLPNYSEDKSYIENPALVASEGRWLLIRRGGIWTDCFVIRRRLEFCDGTGYVDWTKPNDWIQQSDKIETLTGLSPGPMENRQPPVVIGPRGG